MVKDDDLGKIIFRFCRKKLFAEHGSGMLIDGEILDPVGQALRSVHLQHSS